MWASAGVPVPQTPICIYPHRSVVKLPGSKVMGIIPERRLFSAGICLGFEGCVVFVSSQIECSLAAGVFLQPTHGLARQSSRQLQKGVTIGPVTDEIIQGREACAKWIPWNQV